MGHREVRPVALDWEHPQAGGTYSDGSIRYVPLHSRADLLYYLNDQAENPGDYPDGIDLADFMPEIPEGTPYGYQLYETTTEGTPVSPVFVNLETLADWCERNATVYGDIRWTREQWLASFVNDSLDMDSLAYGSPGTGLHVGDPLNSD